MVGRARSRRPDRSPLLVALVVLWLFDGCSSCVGSGGDGAGCCPGGMCKPSCTAEYGGCLEGVCVDDVCEECGQDSDCFTAPCLLAYCMWNHECAVDYEPDGTPCLLDPTLLVATGECRDGECVSAVSDDVVPGETAVCDGSCEVGIPNPCGGLPEEPDACVPSCEGRVCGDDGCGTPCGFCARGLVCAEGSCEPCDPDCTGRVCGSDGCLGSCGACPEGVCAEDGSGCVRDPYSGAARVNAIWAPETADQTGADATCLPPGAQLEGAHCLDINGDGLPDNGFGTFVHFSATVGANIGAVLNEGLQGNPATGEVGLLLTLSEAGGPGDLTLRGHRGVSAAPSGAYVVVPPLGVSLGTLEHATVSDDWLEVANDEVGFGGVLGYFLGDQGWPTPNLSLASAHLRARLTNRDAKGGFAVEDGTMEGLLYKADLGHSLYLARQWCRLDPEAPQDVCGYIMMSDLELFDTMLTWDVVVEGCDRRLEVYDENDQEIGAEPNCEAVSFCFFWSAEKATIMGATTTSNGTDE